MGDGRYGLHVMKHTTSGSSFRFALMDPLPIFATFFCRDVMNVKPCFLGDVLDVLEHRHEWANFHFTWTHFKFVLTKMLPVVASHSKSADEVEINSQYDREFVFSRHPVQLDRIR